MAVEYTIFCDSCGSIIAADRSVRAARAEAQLNCGAISSGGKDWCHDCNARRMAEIAARPVAPAHSVGTGTAA